MLYHDASSDGWDYLLQGHGLVMIGLRALDEFVFFFQPKKETIGRCLFHGSSISSWLTFSCFQFSVHFDFRASIELPILRYMITRSGRWTIYNA